MRRVRRAALALPVFLALAAATQAHAETLTSNLGQPQSTDISAPFTNDFAQGFTTGSNSGGYRLDSVTISIFNPSANVKVRIAKDVSSSGMTEVVGMNPDPASSLASGEHKFTPKTSTVLEKSTKFWVVVEAASGSAKATSGVGQTGWPIDDHHLRRTASSSLNAGFPTDIGTPLRIAVDGIVLKPLLHTPIPDQSVRAYTAFSYRFPSWTFRHTVATTALAYTATLADGTALGDAHWLKFDADTRTFSGTPGAADAGTLSVKVTARDPAVTNGSTASDTFDITVLERLAWGGVPTLTGVKLVGNTGQAQASGVGCNPEANDCGQGFTTGGHAYRLTGVTVRTASHGIDEGITDGTTTSANLFAADTNGRPTGASKGSFTIPTTTGAGLHAFTPTSGTIRLDANTRYVFVMDRSKATTQGNTGYRNTNSALQDAGGEANWDIDASAATRSVASTGSYTVGSTNPLHIQVHGYREPAERQGLCTDANAVAFVDGGSRGTGQEFPTGCALPGKVGEIVVRWEPRDPADLTEFRVRHRRSGGNWSDQTRLLDDDLRETTISSLDSQQSYDVQVRVVHATKPAVGGWGQANTVRPGRSIRSIDSNLPPKISLIRVVSKPTRDSNGDGLDDTYLADDRILVDVELDRPVEVTNSANVTLRLEIGSNNRDVALHSVLKGGTRLRFAYTVVAADSDTDGLRVVAVEGNAVTLGGTGAAKAAIVDPDTNVAANLKWGGLPLAAGARARVDGSDRSSVGPRVVDARVTGKTITVSFDKPIGDPAANKGLVIARLAVQSTDVNGGQPNAYQHPGNVARHPVSRTDLVLTLHQAVKASDTVTLTYDGGSGALTSSTGVRVPAFRDLEVQNNTSGRPAPYRADVAGTLLRVVFDAALDAGSAPAGSRFSVFATDGNLSVRRIAGTGTATVSGKAVLVTLAEALRPDEQASVSYAKPGTNPLRAGAGGNAQVENFSGFAVMTSHDVTAPTLVSGLANILEKRSDDPLKQGKSRIMLYFDEWLEDDVRRAPRPAPGDFALSSTDSGAVADAAVVTVSIEDAAVVLVTSHWLKDNIDYTLVYTPGTHRIRDLAGNAVAGFTETVRSFAVGQPVLRGSTVTGTKLVLNMAQPLNPGALPPPSAFALWETDRVTGETELHRVYTNRVLSVRVQASEAVLQLAHPVYPCAGQRPLRVSYTLPEAGDERFQTAAGWGADGWTAEKWRGTSNDYALVTNEWHGRCAEWLAGTFRGSVVLKSERAFSRDRGEPKPGWFAVSASGGPVTVTGAAFSPHDPKELKLTLSREFAAGETATVSYRRPSRVSGLWDTGGNQLKDVVDEPVAAGPPALGVSDAQAVEGEAVAFTVSLSAASGEAVTVDYATSDGTAAAGAEYTAASGTLTFAAGETAKTVRVATAADAVDEGGETFALTLSNPSGATLADASATGTIWDEAAALTASFHGLPEEHDGSRLFAFEIRFSEEFGGLRLTALKRALSVTGGGLVDAKRTVRGQNRSVTVRVRPSQSGAVTLALAAASDCAAADAVCASDGRSLSAAVSATVPGPDTPLPVLSVADARAGEGGALAFRVTLSEAAHAPVTVDWATADGTAAAGEDYTAATGTLAFAAGETAKTVEVALLHDTAAEDAETLTLALSNASGRAGVGDGEATGTVVDVAPLTAAFEGLPEAHDGAAAFGFEIVFGEEFAGLDLAALEAGALEIGNGELVSAALTNAGQNRRVTVRVRPSSVAEVTLALPAVADCAAAGAICASDGRKLAGAAAVAVPGPVAISLGDAEGEEGVQYAGAEFPVTLNRAASVDVQFEYETVDGTAKAGEDYMATSGRMRIRAGSTRTLWVVVPFLDDDLEEGDETFTVRLLNVQGVPVADGEATGTITEPAPPAPVLDVADAAADEGGTLGFAVTLSRAASGDVTVDYATSDGTAAAGSDYTAVSGTLTFAAGETAKTVTVALLHDTVTEGDETLTLTLSNPTGATLGDAAATGTVSNVAPPALDVADAAADEGGTLSFAVTLSRAAPGDVTVDYATSDGTAAAGSDHTAASGTLTFAAGETEKTVVVAAHHDTAADDAETLTLTLSNPTGATLGDAEATGTVSDVAPLTAAFEGLPAEHDGAAAFGFEIVFGEEFAGLDLAAFGAGALAIGNGAFVDAALTTAGQNRRVTVRVRPSSVDAVTLALPAVADCTAAGAVCADDGRMLAGEGAVTVRGPVAISVGDAQGEEGVQYAGAEFPVTLNRAASVDVYFDYATADGTATAGEDYEATSGRMRIRAGSTRTLWVTVPFLDDALDEDDETFTVRLLNVRGVAVADGEATGTIVEPETPPTSQPVLDAADAAADEGGTLSFAVTLDAAASGAVTVDYATSDGTATAGADYTAASGTLTFAAGDTSKTVSVATLADSILDDDETVTLTLSNPSGATLGDAVAAGTIADVPPVPAAAAADARADEGGTLAFAVTLSEATTVAVTLDYATSDGTATAGADYTAASGTLTFAAGETAKTVSVATLTDSILDDAETITLTLSNPSGATLGDAVAAGTIADVPPVPAAAAADAAADEGETLAFAVTLSEATTVAVTVDYATSDGTATAGADYTAASGTLTFAAGETAKTVSVALLHDAAVEADETLTLTLSNASRATIADAQATGTIVDVAPLTAAFHDLPAEHNGSKRFAFEVRFSEEFQGMRLTALKAGALQVTGGRLIDAKRTVRGQNRSVTVRVRPASVDDMTLTLAATTDCSAASAICASDGRKLSAPVSATVQGPALLSVADASANEGEDATVDFAVTLSRAASAAVTVGYLTVDGTARAGQDYTATRGTLTFTAGETAKTVSVPLLDDALDEGEETFTLKLSNATGARIGDGEATGTIVNSDPMPRAWTARFGRTVSEHLVGALEERLEGPPSESWLQVGGHHLGGGPDVHDTVERLAPRHSLWEEQALWEEAEDPVAQTTTVKDLLLGSAFSLVSNDGGEVRGPRLSAWGRASTSGFDGQEEKVTLSGTVTTATLGVDGVWKRWLTGVALAYSVGDGSFTHLDLPGGDLESSLTSVHPYVAYTLSDRVRLWGMVGYGSGSLELRLEDQSPLDTDLALAMGALGMRGTLLEPTADRHLQLALRSDLLWTRTDTAAAPNLAETQAEVSRLRLVLEGSRPVVLAGGGSFIPTLELGLRHDGGDAETGTGIEVGGRVHFASAWGLSFEASVRSLVAHQDTDYREWGASAALRFAPGGQGTGFTAAIVPTWGQAASGVATLWDQRSGAGLPGGVASPAARLDAEMGYGLATLRGRGLLMPYARLALSEGAGQAWHLGTRLALRESLNLSLEASRRAVDGQAAAHEVALRANLGW